MSKYIRNEENLSSKIHDEIVMVNIDLGNYFSLNPVGSDIWEILQDETSSDELISKLMEMYEIDEATCSKEVNSFLSELLAKKLIREV